MDLSWCIICDRHCTEDNLYCSQVCERKDIACETFEPVYMPLSPPSSPLMNSPHSFYEKPSVCHKRPFVLAPVSPPSWGCPSPLSIYDDDP
ncbi:uncharacterized protein BYT42DRAFT_618705 [Radiomyces spectabilis]|uniref:uncharacterized protein n=1 Tax=Radiomyces spectabilis TaxID=64574 RepID=UPI00221E8B33|nr:uncharacterized protein BYT42DRAFT_618705 [Radiomyces spectabilis]KAI8365327.1 hypothetical protein BYT42DRAFT_618705 [Radiomyces spectabilis]